MKYCPNCGTKLFKNSKFCHECGTNLSIYQESNSTFRYGKSKSTNSVQKDKNDYIKLYNIITNYLWAILPQEISEKDLSEYFVSYKKDNFKDLCICCFSTLQDYQYLPNVIGFNKQDRKPIFKKVLMDYDFRKIMDKYDEDSLFEAFCNSFPVKNKESKSNSWRRYSVSVLSTCKYLSQFNDITEYNDYCESFNGSIELPKLVEKNIKGMGFALACLLLKDTGFMDYCKPDVHLKDVLSQTGYCENNDYSVFNCVHEMAKANNVKAYEIDSKIWLVCSGSYYKHNIKTMPHKVDLIKAINGN